LEEILIFLPEVLFRLTALNQSGQTHYQPLFTESKQRTLNFGVFWKKF